MPFNSTATLSSGKKGAVVFSNTDATFTASGACTIVDSSPGGDSGSGYPGYTRPSGDFLTDGFKVGDYVRVTAAAADANGSNAAPKVFRIAYLVAGFMGVEGPGASSIADAAANATFTIRKVRIFRLANFRAAGGPDLPVTLQASTSTNLAGTVVHMSLDDGVTWDALPNVILPDTNNGSAKVVQFFTGWDVALMIVPGTGFAGKISAG